MVNLTELKKLAEAAAKEVGCDGCPIDAFTCSECEEKMNAQIKFADHCDPTQFLKLISALEIQREALEFYAAGSGAYASSALERVKEILK